MSDEAAREEAYMNRLINRNRQANAKPTVAAAPSPSPFGGLEAARAQAGMGAKPAPTGSTGRISREVKPNLAPAAVKPAFVPPPLETEVVELPPPKPASTPFPPPLEEEVVELPLHPGVSKQDVEDEAARKEAERMAKSIGKFHLGPKLAPASTGHPPNTQTAPRTTTAPPQQPAEKVKKDWELPPTVPQYNTKFESFLYAEISLARSSPDLIIDRLRDRRNHYQGKEYRHPENGSVLQTQEGVAGVDSAIKFLSSVTPIRQKLQMVDGLSLSARDFCDFARATTSPAESDQQAENRFTRYGNYGGNISQNVAFSNVVPSELILDWIIDDGQEPFGRPHRHAIFNENAHFLGIASGPHTFGRVICVIMTEDYKALDEDTQEISLPFPGQAPPSNSSTAGIKTPSSDYVYPNFQIGGLTPVNASVNILPITSLACQIHELYLGIRENGTVLEFSRSVVQNARPRKEIQKFTLPYPVTPQTVSAKYFPTKSNGELVIQLGKQTSNEGALSLEFTIASFTVLADPFTSSTRVQITIDQQPDHFIFAPGPSSKYNTEFKVVLNGNVLEFRSTYSFEENGSVQTVNGKQSIQLPFPPTLNQIDTDGSTITIWPNRRSQSSLPVPNSDIPIILG